VTTSSLPKITLFLKNWEFLLSSSRHRKQLFKHALVLCLNSASVCNRKRETRDDLKIAISRFFLCFSKNQHEEEMRDDRRVRHLGLTFLLKIWEREWIKSKLMRIIKSISALCEAFFSIFFSSSPSAINALKRILIYVVKIESC
jgi:hypothetical protein